MNREEAANHIEAFIEGTSRPWDWDDFLHTTTKDETISHLQKLCISLPDRYPPDKPNYYCNEEGIKILKEAVRVLRIKNDNEIRRK